MKNENWTTPLIGPSFSTSKGPTLQSDASQPNTEKSLDRSACSQTDFPTNNNNQIISNNDNIVHHPNLIQQNSKINLDEPFNPKELQIINDSNKTKIHLIQCHLIHPKFLYLKRRM